MYRLLVVDDVPDLLDALAAYLGHTGFDVTTCRGPDEALAALELGAFDVALVDHRLHGEDGQTLVRDMAGVAPRMPVALMSGSGTAPEGSAAATFVAKPFLMRDLAETLRELADHQDGFVTL